MARPTAAGSVIQSAARDTAAERPSAGGLDPDGGRKCDGARPSWGKQLEASLPSSEGYRPWERARRLAREC